MKEIDRAWLAGLLEGEGSFRKDQRGRRAVSLIMNDHDVVMRASRLMGGPVKCYARKPPRPTHPYYTSYVGGEKAVRLMRCILPYLGGRRTAKVQEILGVVRPRPHRVGLHWTAGLLEGEGYFGFYSGSPVVSLSMKDRDVVEKASKVMRAPSVRMAPGHVNSDPLYVTRACGVNALRLMEGVLPLMGKRRKKKILRAMALSARRPGWTTGRRVLTQSDANEIRRRYALSANKDLAREFGVSPATITRAALGVSFKGGAKPAASKWKRARSRN